MTTVEWVIWFLIMFMTLVTSYRVTMLRDRIKWLEEVVYPSDEDQEAP